MTSDPNRRPWTEGPVVGVPPESWQALDDDALLHRIETLDPEQDADALLLEIVQSSRHFFIRQAAAKRIRKRALLFAYEDDRHIGQILVRHLTRREDMTYLERLLARSQHAEVRRAAQAQLGRLTKKFAAGPPAAPGATTALKPRSWRVAVLHGDGELRRRVIETLGPPEFRAEGFPPNEEAALEIEAFDPHLVLADVNAAQVTREIHDTIRRKSLCVPLVVLCPPDMGEPLVQVLGRGADEFIMLPLHPPLLAAKTRALLHFAHRSGGLEAERRTLSGTVAAEGVLEVFRLCEEKRMTCRLLVVNAQERRWADFLEGEMVEAGGEPAVPDEEALAALLSLRTGHYEIVERPGEEAPERQPAAYAASVISGSASSAGAPAALAPAAAPAAAKPAAAAAPTPPAPAAATSPARERDDVDATLLGWAIHFIVERAWAHLGTAATAGLLRRTHHETIASQPLLRFFAVEEKAHVRVDISQGARLPRGAIAAVAQWMAAFLSQARRVVAEAGGIQVRQATALMADALDQAGFYSAYDQACGRSGDAS